MAQNSPRRMNSSTTNLRFVSSIRDAIVELRCSTCESILGDPPDTPFIDGSAVDAKRLLVPRRAPSHGFSNVSQPFYPVLRCLLAYCNGTATRSGQSRTEQKYSTVNGIEIRLFMGISLICKDRKGGSGFLNRESEVRILPGALLNHLKSRHFLPSNVPEFEIRCQQYVSSSPRKCPRRHPYRV